MSVGQSVCRPSVFRLISFYLFTRSIPNLVQELPSFSRWSLLIFRSHVQWSRSNHSSQLGVFVRSISFDPFTWSIPNLMQGLPLTSRRSLLIFGSHVQRSRSNHSSQPNVLSAQYILTSSLDQYQTWCRGCPQWLDDHNWFQVTCSKVMSNHSSQPSVLSAQYLLTSSLYQYKNWCRVCAR